MQNSGRDRAGRGGAVRARLPGRGVGRAATTPRTTTRSSTSGSARPGPGRVEGRSDFDMYVERGLEATARRRPGLPRAQARLHWTTTPPVLEALRAAHERGAIVYAHCSARLRARRGRPARRAGVHHALALHRPAREHASPRPRSGPTSSTATTATCSPAPASAAGIDASLHLMRENFGAHVAATTARRIVVPPHRDGGQAQFIARPVVDCDAETLGPLLEWILEQPRRGPRRRHPRPQVADVAAHLRPPVPRRDRRHAARLGHQAAGAARRAAARADRPLGRVDRRRGRASATPPRCATTSPARAGSARSSTAAPSAPRAWPSLCP